LKEKIPTGKDWIREQKKLRVRKTDKQTPTVTLRQGKKKRRAKEKKGSMAQRTAEKRRRKKGDRQGVTRGGGKVFKKDSPRGFKLKKERGGT